MNLASTDGGDYRCVVSNAAGSGSDAASLYVRPTIISQPTNVSTMVGNSVSFSCAADGFPMPTYHWEKMQQDDIYLQRSLRCCQ